MTTLFTYDTAFVQLPRAAKLDAFIEKWNRHEGAQKYRHDGVNLHVCGRIYKRVERWENGEQQFDDEQQELIDCFEHEGREDDVRLLAEKGASLQEQINGVLESCVARGTLFFCKTSAGMMRFDAEIYDEDEATFTIEIKTGDSVLGCYSDAVRESLAFQREEVHSHHLEVNYFKTLPKLKCPITRNWLYFVRYRGWIIRVAEEQGARLLLVGMGSRVKRWLLEPIFPFAAGAKWVDRNECEPVEMPYRPLSADSFFPASKFAAPDTDRFRLPIVLFPRHIAGSFPVPGSPEKAWTIERNVHIRGYLDDALIQLVNRIFCETDTMVRRYQCQEWWYEPGPLNFDPETFEVKFNEEWWKSEEVTLDSQYLQVQIFDEDEEHYRVRVIPRVSFLGPVARPSEIAFLEEAGFRNEPGARTAQASGQVRNIPKLPNHLTQKWLNLVRYRGWILRAVEQDDDNLLLVGCGDKALMAGVLDPISTFAAGARWVARRECEIIQYGTEEYPGKQDLAFGRGDNPSKN